MPRTRAMSKSATKSDFAIKTSHATMFSASYPGYKLYLAILGGSFICVVSRTLTKKVSGLSFHFLNKYFNARILSSMSNCQK